MAKYRKNPVEVEVRQVPRLGDDIIGYCDASIDLAKWCGGRSYMMLNDDEESYKDSCRYGPHIIIPTLEGEMMARPGDYIIRGVQGEFYPCKQEIFEETYEPVIEYD